MLNDRGVDTMRTVFFLFLALGFSAGCGSSGPGLPLTPVTGTVMLDGVPVAEAKVNFFPQLETKGNGGWGITDASGKYALKTPQGGTGVPDGAYKVTVSLRRNPDGSLPKPDEPPIESKAKETLPAIYSNESKTTLKADVSSSAKQFDWSLKAKGK